MTKSHETLYREGHPVTIKGKRLTSQRVVEAWSYSAKEGYTIVMAVKDDVDSAHVGYVTIPWRTVESAMRARAGKETDR